jgi:cell fate (sporulation/competence/biofilm development) regulator YlbF (YheA/YmcA/DUF963 family)
MSALNTMAKDLGATIGRTDEYQALQRAIKAADDDKTFVEARTELEALEGQMEAELRAGRELSDEMKGGYEGVMDRIQVNSTYQRVVAAQANFEKLMQRVNAVIAEGMKEGGRSRIVLAP